MEYPAAADERATTDELALVRPMAAFRLLGIGKTFGYKLLKNGTLPKVKIGDRAIGIPVAALRALIEGGTPVPQSVPVPTPPVEAPRVLVKRPDRRRGKGERR